MKIRILLFWFLILSLSAQGQSHLVKQWDYRFGGSNYDVLSSFQQTADGGFILCGYSNSGISGDKSQPSQGSYDYWIVKTDSLGIKLWDKDFGGTDTDYLYSIQQTVDGGFILGGYSNSGISGDKSQASRGSYDYWIIKTDSLGNKQWDKDFGGNADDELFSIQQTADGGFILGGFSVSDSSGDKSQASRGFYDYWIVKTDSLGNKQWDKDFGGTDYDGLHSIQQTSDGGFILGGYSHSDIGGDKTQALWLSVDFWIVKTDSLGNKLWDKDIGGTGVDLLFSIQQTSDGGFILGGYSSSGISGDKSQVSQGSYDYWIVKTDAQGNKTWDKDFGGTGFEELQGNPTLTSDGGFLFAGTSYSGIGGDKTEANLGLEQSWIVKTDSLGNKVWEKTLLTTGHDEFGYAVETTERGCYLMANYSNGGIGGDKTQANWDTSNWTGDYWIIKFCDTICITSVSISVNGDTLTAYNATTYQWYLNGNPIGGANQQTYIAIQGGSYTVAVTDTNGCSAVSTPVIISGIAQLSEGEGWLRIYPNPLETGLWNLEVEPALLGSTLEIFDAQGKLLLMSKIENRVSNIELNAARGVYVLRVSSAKGGITRKLVKL